MFKEYSKGMIYRHSKKLLDGELKEDKRSESGICLPSKTKLSGLPKYQKSNNHVTGKRRFAYIKATQVVI